MAVTNKVSARDGGTGSGAVKMMKQKLKPAPVDMSKNRNYLPEQEQKKGRNVAQNAVGVRATPAGGGVGYNQPKTGGGSSVAQNMTNQLLSKQYEGVQKKGVVAAKPRKGR